MLEISARLLRLLSLLQARRDWTGTELATRLGVTTRTIRNDMDRLRGLGYPVDARPGVTGGYRLGTHGALPPLLLDDEEAVAVAVGLRTAASGSIAGIEETSVRALAKLQQVLPPRLRHKVSVFQSSALPMPSRGPQVDPEVLTVIASACRDHEQLRFGYQTHSGADELGSELLHLPVHGDVIDGDAALGKRGRGARRHPRLAGTGRPPGRRIYGRHYHVVTQCNGALQGDPCSVRTRGSGQRGIENGISEFPPLPDAVRYGRQGAFA
jgi:biotin operon repressor